MNKETIKPGQITIDFLVEAADTKGAVSMFEFTVPAGAKVPIPHYHENFDETIYGEVIRVHVKAYLRPQEKYNDLEELKTALHQDKKESLRLL